VADEVVITVRADDQFSSVLGNFGSIMTGIESAIHLAGEAFNFFTDEAMQGLDAIAQYERLTATLETLSARELLATGSFKDMNAALEAAGPMAAELLDWMQQLAINSPFTLEGVATAFRTAEAYGFTAEQAQELTQAMIDFAAGSGATEGVMNQIALALGQIQAKGHVAGQEMLQLVNAGLPATQILADGFGVTTEKIGDMISEGLVPADQAIRILTDYLESNFAGAAQRQANTWAGLQGTFADIQQMGLRDFFGGLFEVLQPLAVALSTFLQTEGLDKLKELGKGLGEITKGVLDFLGLTEEKITTVFPGGVFSYDFFFAGQQPEEIKTLVFKSMDEILSGIQNKIVLWWSGIDWKGISQNMTDFLNSIDWNAVGFAIGDGFRIAFNTAGKILQELDTKEFEAALAKVLRDSVNGAIEGAFQGTIFADTFPTPDEMMGDFPEKMKEFWDNLFANISLNYAEFRQIGREIIGAIQAGFTGGFDDWWNAVQRLWIDYIVYVKNVLGISSPSTVFASIGRDIVNGLIAGWDATIGQFLTAIGNTIEDIGNLFGIDLSGLLGGGTSASGLGTAGGGTAGGSAGGSSGSVINNYYGPVYFGSTGEPNSYYDCPSPNPLVAASGNQLVATGF